MVCVDVGAARMAGSGGIGDGERPRPCKPTAESDGDAAAWDPENEDRLEPGLLAVDGGFIAVGACCGVEGTEVLGVIGAPEGLIRLGGNSVCSDAEVMTEPFSEVVDARRAILGRALVGIDGVRE